MGAAPLLARLLPLAIELAAARVRLLVSCEDP
jgi:hypothetical protein